MQSEGFNYADAARRNARPVPGHAGALGVAEGEQVQMNAALELGLLESVVQRSVNCVHGPQPSWTRWQGPPSRQPEVRADLARTQTRLDAVRLMLADAVQAAWQRPADVRRSLLQVRTTAGESAVQVAELGMKVCGQFAFRKESGVERRFRDAHLATYGQFPVDAALDHLGRTLCGLPLLA